MANQSPASPAQPAPPASPPSFPTNPAKPDVKQPNSSDFKPASTKWGLIFLLLVLLGLGIFLYKTKSAWLTNLLKFPAKETEAPKEEKKVKQIEKHKIVAFESTEDFKAYLDQIQALKTEEGYGRASFPMGFEDLAIGAQPVPAGAEKATRISETNVQVIGIDEPDIVKTDGQKIYFSALGYGIYRTSPVFLEERSQSIVPPPRQTEETKIINAFPPANLKQDNVVNKSGNLLLANKTLTIFSQNYIYGFDVSDPLNPKEKWKIEISSNNQPVDSRLYQGKIYLVTQSNISRDQPCPIKLLTGNGQEINISCNQIYHPQEPVYIDSTYTVMVIDPQTGKVEKNISFVGKQSSSIVYMSPQSIFVTYNYFGDIMKFVYEFFNSTGKDLIPESVLERIKKLKDYDLSFQSKLTEYSVILDEYTASLGKDERLKLENELNNRMEDYISQNAREIEKTGLVRITVADLNLASSGSIPGQPLNQFSLDEYQNHLRIATTVSGSIMMFSQGESINDLYVLDKDLDIVGQIQGLALGEKIYSARFIEDKGYLVTFKQIDPFFVFDLSDPKNPQKKGELKIPGYSAYLHPINKDTILGIGEEGNKVKLSLFNVSDLSQPQEIDKYSLDEYWTEVNSNHHAFLLDPKHQVFFLPGGKGGYIFSFKDNKFKLEKAVAQNQTKRAVYLDNFLYIIGLQDLIVLDENNWEEVNKLEY